MKQRIGVGIALLALAAPGVAIADHGGAHAPRPSQPLDPPGYDQSDAEHAEQSRCPTTSWINRYFRGTQDSGCYELEGYAAAAQRMLREFSEPVGRLT